MRIFVSVLAMLFGALHLAAGTYAEFKGKDTAAQNNGGMMAMGGLFAFMGDCSHLSYHPSWLHALLLAFACIFICYAAYANGRRSGNFHLSHHIVRGGIAVLLVVGFLIW